MRGPRRLPGIIRVRPLTMRGGRPRPGGHLSYERAGYPSPNRPGSNDDTISAPYPRRYYSSRNGYSAHKGRDFSIAFNPEFFMAPLRALTEDEVFLDLIDEMSPGVLKIQTPFLYVLMLMRISS